MRRGTALLALAALLSTTFGLAAPAESPLDRRPGPERATGSVSSDFALRSPDDLVHVFIQLDQPSVAEFAAAARVRPARADQQRQGARVRAQQDRVVASLGALIVEERSRLVVAANGIRALVRAGDIIAIRSQPEVRSVAPVTRYHLDNSTSVPWIGGTAVGSAGFTGDGVRIAIIDTGIDYTHASFGGPGTPEAYADNHPGIVEPATFPTAKVVGGFDFAGPVYDASDPDLATPRPDPDPLDVDGHGTHVAATAAGLDVPGVGAGMAPGALLYAYKVFGDVAGSTELVSDAIERALDPNNDLSVDDAVDIINMSLGASFGDPNDPSAIAARNAVELGVVVVASAGNSGDVPYITGSPAVAEGVISVAASIDGGVTSLAMTVNSPAALAGDYLAEPGDFGPLDPPTTADLFLAAPNFLACEPISDDLSGHILLVRRGQCTFSTKVRHAQEAGAVGVLVFNNVDGPPIAMGQDGSPGQPTIPAMMVGLDDGLAIQQAATAETVNVTLTDSVEVPLPALADNLAEFTSRGPGHGNAFKPDLAAPGFNIASARAGSGDGSALLSGTSMAAPHVAGAAAQLLDKYPGLHPTQIKALLANSATPALVEGPTFVPGAMPLARQGTGVMNIERAALALGGYATPSGVSFGRVNPTATTSVTRTVTIQRLSGEATYDVAVVPNQSHRGVSWSTSAATVTTTGGTATLTVRLSVDPAAMSFDDGFFSQREADGWLMLTNQADPDDVLAVGLLAVVDPASGINVTGSTGSVNLTNTGVSTGFADGFTWVSDGFGTLANVGYRTTPGGGDDGDLIEFGIELSEQWFSPSTTEVDILFDVDQDLIFDYALVAADLGFLTGGPATGLVVTALIDLTTFDGFLSYFALADLNDRVMVLPIDLTGPFGFLADDATSFDMTTLVWDQVGLAGVSDTVTVDLTAEVTADDGLSFLLPGGVAGTVDVDGGGKMLWLFQNNRLPAQAKTVTVRAAPPPPPPPPPTPGFVDVPPDHLFWREITWLAEEGITRGCNPPRNDRFCPDDPVTRGQMAAFLNRALRLPATSTDFFVDDEDSVFEADINRLAQAGITRGCNPPRNDRFCPLRVLTRAEMATFMVRAFGFNEGAGSDRFVDDDGNIHEKAIDILGTVGVTRGCNPPRNDRFCPDSPMTRGQMAAFIYRAFQIWDG